jgi:hypothetical protein
MTVSDMQLAIRLNLDKSTSLVGAVDFLPEELDFWLNEGQERFIKDRLFGSNLKQQSFDKSQKRIDDLKSIVVLGSKINVASSSFASNVVEASLPITDANNPYLFYIDSTLYDTNNNPLGVQGVVSFEVAGRYFKDTINNPYIRRPLVFFYHNTVDKIAFIYGDEFIPTKCDITYIRKPRQLVSGTPIGYQTNTCELPEHTHKEIVSDVVKLLLENIESQRSQTFTPLNQTFVE